MYGSFYLLILKPTPAKADANKNLLTVFNRSSPFGLKTPIVFNNQFAFVAGTAINDTSSVAGAQATFQAMINDPNLKKLLHMPM